MTKLHRWPSGFSRWLFNKNTRKLDRRFGDLADDARVDTGWPHKSDKFYDFYFHLTTCGASDDCLETMFDAWKKYSGVDYKRTMCNVEKFFEGEIQKVSLSSSFHDASPGRTFIYTLIETYELQPDKAMYIGQTNSPTKRIREHAFSSHNKLVSAWSAGLFNDGKSLLMVILDNVNASLGQQYERAYIETFDYNLWGSYMFNVKLKGPYNDKIHAIAA